MKKLLIMFLVLTLLLLCINFALNWWSAIHYLLGLTGKSAGGDTTCSPWRTPCWSTWTAQRRLWLHEKSMLKQILEVCGPTKRESHTRADFTGRTCTSGGTHTGTECSRGTEALWKEPTLVQLIKDCHPWVRPCAGAGEECGEEGVAQTTWNELTAIPIPHSPWGREIRSKAEPRKKGEAGESYFKDLFLFLIILLRFD